METPRESGLTPLALLRSVTNAGTSLTRRVLFPPLPPPPRRPFRVSNWDRSKRTGIVASSLNELIEKAIDAFLVTVSLVTFVLEEDGTVVDTEDFFQSLGDNTHILILEGKQKWKPGKYGTCPVQPVNKKGIANITLDLYKLNPKDFVGCLNFKATFYDKYSIAFDIKCLGAKKLLRKMLQLFSHVAQVAGHLLLYSSSLMMQWSESSEERAHSYNRRA
uniref:Cell death inducing DFFA like effector a n=1 Tax=Leptobrachium leishanense TaxID=445787 RepID=A0A8C5QSP5_9ANUR